MLCTVVEKGPLNVCLITAVSKTIRASVICRRKSEKVSLRFFTEKTSVVVQKESKRTSDILQKQAVL